MKQARTPNIAEMRKIHGNQSEKMTPLVSVVVPTRNSGKTIEACLKSVVGQTGSDIEVVVVDCYSRDNTMEIVDRFGARISRIRTMRSSARNIGAEIARGNLILFLDADMELDPFVIQRCVEKIQDCCDAVVIPEVSIGEGFWAECKALEKMCYVGDNEIEAARFVRKSVFESVGGYDQELEADEDWDLNQRIRKAGYRIGRINAVIRHDEGKLLLRETMLKKNYYGKTLKRYRRKHPREAKRQLTLIRPAFARNWKKLATDPIHALGIFVMKTCEFLAGWMGSVN